MKKTILPALAVATFAAHALTFGSTANAHTLYERGWWKNKTLVEVADGQRAGIDHSLAVVRFFEVRPHIVGPHRDRALAWHRTHLRITRRELAKTLAGIEVRRRATAAAEAAAQVVSSEPVDDVADQTASAGGNASEATAACESGGDPTAVSSDGVYRGKWQFDQQTWDAHAPDGWKGVDPTAAPESVQDEAAGNVTYDAWPNC